MIWIRSEVGGTRGPAAFPKVKSRTSAEMEVSTVSQRRKS
jgi:hypothetical protein